MESYWNSSNKIVFISIVFLFVGGHLAWDFFNGGVPSHHILQREDLPSVSNWWGILLLPGLAAYTLWRIEKRNLDPANQKNAMWGFIGALIFGITLSVFFKMETNVPGYMMLALLASSFFIPFYRIEYLMGFVLGMLITFGGVLPLGVGTILVAIGAFSYLIIRRGVLLLFNRMVG